MRLKQKFHKDLIFSRPSYFLLLLCKNIPKKFSHTFKWLLRLFGSLLTKSISVIFHDLLYVLLLTPDFDQ